MMKKLMAALLAAMMLLTLAVTAALAEDGILRPGDSGDEVAKQRVNTTKRPRLRSACSSRNTVCW